MGCFKNIFRRKQGTRSLDDSNQKKGIWDDSEQINGIWDDSEQKKGIWDDLPQEVLVLIFKKLNIFSDQVRFRTVCKDWRLPDDAIGGSDYLSESCRLINHLCANSIVSYDVRPFSFTHSSINTEGELRASLDSVREFTIHEKRFEQITLHASKYGWLLFNTSDISEVKSYSIGLEGRVSLIFLHNPFTKDVIPLPDLGNFTCEAATFTMNPSRSECEFLVLCRPKDVGDALYVGQCCLARDKVWSMTHLENITQKHLSMCYMNGELYCLFAGGMLKSYNLIEESWKLVVESLPQPYASSRVNGRNAHGYWLIEDGKKLMMVWRRREKAMDKWLIFSMDWSFKIWYIERNLNVSIFINGNTSLIAPLVHAPLVHYKGNIERDCFVFYYDALSSAGELIKYCYSLKTDIRFLRYIRSSLGNLEAISFIEAPHVRNISSGTIQ